MTEESPAQPLEASAKGANTHQTQVAGVNQDFDAIEVSTEFIKEDLCVPEDDTTDNKFNIEGVDLSDVYDEDNIAVDANSSLQELIANSSYGEPLINVDNSLTDLTVSKKCYFQDLITKGQMGVFYFEIFAGVVLKLPSIHFTYIVCVFVCLFSCAVIICHCFRHWESST